MNATSTMDLFTVQLGRATRGLETARNTRNVQLAALNGRQLFRIHLMIGLLRWRHGVSPAADFENAVQSVPEVSELIREYDPSVDTVASLPIARAMLLSRLLGGKPLEPSESRASDSSLPTEVRLDFLLASGTHTDDIQRSAAGLIAELSSDTWTALAADGYENYFGLLASSKDAEEVGRRAERGSILFLRRARDPYYSGGDQTEGGGEGNAEVVDYRLAIALKEAKYEGASVHEWRW